MKEVSEYQLKITGSASLGQAIDTTKSLRVGVDLDIYSVEKFENQDGTTNVRYKAKITSAIDVMQGEKIFKGKDKTKASQRLRWALEAKGRALGLDPEVYYQETMNKIISEI